MIEKIISLDNVSLVDFLGAENVNIKTVAHAFPSSKIISRGHEIKIIGKSEEVAKLDEIFANLIQHYNKYGKISSQEVNDYIAEEIGPSDHREQHDNVILFGPKGLVVKPRSANQSTLVQAILKNDLTFALGPAGTGKTYIAVAMAVQALKNKEIKKIIITRPAVEAGENLGFLPGDLKDKVDPYLRPIYDALGDMIQSEKLNYFMENNIIEIAPLAFMRGRTLNNAFVLLDEAQNTTPMQIKMFMTRLGPSSKMIITGDISQTDLPTKQSSGLREAIKILKDVKGIAITRLQAKDVVRHDLVKRIIEAYDSQEADHK